MAVNVSQLEALILAKTGRVLLSVRVHRQNRVFPAAGRLLANRLGRAWAAPDWRL